MSWVSAPALNGYYQFLREKQKHRQALFPLNPLSPVHSYKPESFFQNLDKERVLYCNL